MCRGYEQVFSVGGGVAAAAGDGGDDGPAVPQVPALAAGEAEEEVGEVRARMANARGEKRWA